MLTVRDIISGDTAVGDLDCVGCVDNSEIGDDAVGLSEIKQGTLFFGTYNDDATGNANGWDPDNVEKTFFISESRVVRDDFVGVSLDDANSTVCISTGISPGTTFTVECTEAPIEGASISYLVSGGE